MACLAEHGWAGSTVSVVAERAGVSRGAAQHHFPHPRGPVHGGRRVRRRGALRALCAPSSRAGPADRRAVVAAARRPLHRPPVPRRPPPVGRRVQRGPAAPARHRAGGPRRPRDPPHRRRTPGRRRVPPRRPRDGPGPARHGPRPGPRQPPHRRHRPPRTGGGAVGGPAGRGAGLTPLSVAGPTCDPTWGTTSRRSSTWTRGRRRRRRYAARVARMAAVRGHRPGRPDRLRPGRPLGHPPGPNWLRACAREDADWKPSDGLAVEVGTPTVFSGGQGEPGVGHLPALRGDDGAGRRGLRGR